MSSPTLRHESQQTSPHLHTQDRPGLGEGPTFCPLPPLAIDFVATGCASDPLEACSGVIIPVADQNSQNSRLSGRIPMLRDGL